MKYNVITISREFGSGGHSIGESVAKALDIPFYDQNLLEHIASETGFSQEFIKEAAEYATAKNSLLFNLVMNRSLNGRTELTPTDSIYIAQSKIITELADKESCVIVGRCADYILRDRPGCFHVFICADPAFRGQRSLERYGDNGKPITKRIEDRDTRRKIYYSNYTDQIWGAPQNYQLCLNSSKLGIGRCVGLILGSVDMEVSHV